MIKRLKLLAGFSLVAVSTYAILGEHLAGSSSDATINAQIVTLRAPIEGQLSLESRNLGSRVSPNQTIGFIRDPRPDDNRLHDLQRAEATATAERDRIRDVMTRLVSSRRAFEQQAATYAEGRINQLTARIAETHALQQAAEARAREASAALERSASLNRSGIQTAAELGRVRSVFEVATQEVEATRQRAQFLTIEVTAARQGISLGDSYSDMPYSQQRMREISARVAELGAEAEEREQRLKMLGEQIAVERVRLARFAEARLISHTPTTYWEVLASDNEFVRRGQDIARMVDCSTTLVTASVPETVYNTLTVGDPAQFRLTGAGKVYQATVARLAGSGAASVYRNLAIGPSPSHLTRFDVALLVPELAADPVQGCAVGRTGRVVFSGRPLDLWRKFLAQSGL